MIEVITLTLLSGILILAVLTVEVTDLLYAALSLCGMCTMIGILFGVLNATYVMVFQLLIYAGTTISLFIIVIMLTRRGDE